MTHNYEVTLISDNKRKTTVHTTATSFVEAEQIACAIELAPNRSVVAVTQKERVQE